MPQARPKVDRIYLAVLIMSFPGYPLVAAFATLTGLPSTPLSLGMRALNFCLALLLIVGGIARRRGRSASVLLLLLGLFWAAYVVRLYVDTLYEPLFLGKEVSYYWVWAVGGCLVPMLGLAMRTNRPEQADDYFRWLYLATFAGSFLSVFLATGTVSNEAGIEYESGRMRLEALNPIALGHLGAMLVVLSAWALLFHRPWSRGSRRLFLLLGLAVGCYVLLAANSRGPVLAVLACFLFLLSFVSFRYKFAVMAFLLVGALAAVPLSVYLQEAHNINAFGRLFGMSLEQHAQQSSRLDLFDSALEMFWTNPWLGGALEDPTTLSYPHNVIVESLMALGLFVTLLFIGVLAGLGARAALLFRRYPNYGWPALLLLQYFVGAQFSGSLYGSTFMWCAIGLVLSFGDYAPEKAPRLSRNLMPLPPHFGRRSW
ncbi:O-antigen ligase family protein [Ancylobacter sp. IITR112]|uniref:O-antigen ligase family protein n=1 Tax=Ancylobacter sp. IITR112 TaxID=3138073 RepID=UPI00352AD748